MSPQPPSLRIFAPGAVNLAASDLDLNDVVSVINKSPRGAQTTLQNLGAILGVLLWTSVLSQGAKGNGIANDAPAFTAADVTGNIAVPAGTYLLNSNVTLASQVIFAEGAVLKPAAGTTLTINGAVSAGLWQILDLSLGGSVVLNDVEYVQARWFGASPSAAAATNAAAFNNAITCAKSSNNADMMIGPGAFQINSSLLYGTANRGITTIGIPEGSSGQGSTQGACTLVWTGGAAPMIQVNSTFNNFYGFNLQNNTTATYGIQATVGGRLWLNRINFECPNGSNAFSVASVEINILNYDRITLCEFMAGPGIRVIGPTGNTLLVDQFLCDSAVGSGAFIDIRSPAKVITLREGTMNYEAAGIATFIDMTNIGSNTVGTLTAERTEFDGAALPIQMYVAKVKNCSNFIFRGNYVSGMGDAANVESPITLTNSFMSLGVNYATSLAQPLVHTLDTASYVYVYEGQQNVAATKGWMTSSSQSGNRINAVISATDVIIQGNLASASSPAVFLATLTSAGSSYAVDIAQPADSNNKGFSTPGQIFTIDFYNNSGGTLAAFGFSNLFNLNTPAFAPPPNGKRAAITFQWDGAAAWEIGRQYDANPTWTSITSITTLAPSQNRVEADATAGGFTISLPRADTVQSGFRVIIKKITAANTVTINGGAFLIDGAANQALTTQWSSFTMESDGTQWLIVAKV